MDEIVLQNFAESGEIWKAVFLPSKGMTLKSLKKGDVELIDQSTMAPFEKRNSGLGPLIGPHFHTHTKYKYPEKIFQMPFSHMKTIIEEKRKDPFSHGIARYAPWNSTHSETQIQGVLKGSDIWEGVPLSYLEGQDFELNFSAKLLANGLHIELKIQSEKPSMLGLHYYYKIQTEKSIVKGDVVNQYNDQGKIIKPIPKDWIDNGHLAFDLKQEADFGFIPNLTEHHQYIMHVEMGKHMLHFGFNTEDTNQMQCQVFHPKDSSYVCIEPMTAYEPRKPILNRSRLEAHINYT